MNQLRIATVHAASALLMEEPWECRCNSCKTTRISGIAPTVTNRDSLAACLLGIDDLNTPLSEKITEQTIARVDAMPDEEVRLRLQFRQKGGHEFSSKEKASYKKSKQKPPTRKGRILREGKTMGG